jgi:hypothetical protein
MLTRDEPKTFFLLDYHSKSTKLYQIICFIQVLPKATASSIRQEKTMALNFLVIKTPPPPSPKGNTP